MWNIFEQKQIKKIIIINWAWFTLRKLYKSISAKYLSKYFIYFFFFSECHIQVCEHSLTQCLDDLILNFNNNKEQTVTSLYIVCKSFILNVNLIDQATLGGKDKHIYTHTHTHTHAHMHARTCTTTHTHTHTKPPPHTHTHTHTHSCHPLANLSLCLQARHAHPSTILLLAARGEWSDSPPCVWPTSQTHTHAKQRSGLCQLGCGGQLRCPAYALC